MRFPNPTPIAEVLDSIRSATANPTEPGIPIYVDPIGLQEADRSMNSTVQIDLEGLPLKTSLRLMLKQLGLVYTVEDGLLRVSSEDEFWYSYEDPFHEAAEYYGTPGNLTRATLSKDIEDPYLIVGHCLLALLAAGFGGVAAPLLAGLGRKQSSLSG